ncbi:proteinase inhibitor I4 serpin [Streptomyces sp. MMG1533]|uniref:serpin family protein n=1 Tax=Streptomyces sp. MMG1533 TaxID=1415546 RepID=UPI0006AE8CD3|nr:serpin family protein [Streptomyces sp. MMG1533]KOU70086.1 proteinase inhibitor I4 serpin [Streptomyces sp. MMG1533]
MIDAVNGLSARWAGTVEGGTVFSAVGVWPLLAFLADGATGAARKELAEAVGMPADQAAAAARELLAESACVEGLDSGLGLWSKRTVELREEWAAGLPSSVHGVLTGDLDADQRALDAWAAERTGGMVRHIPVALRPDSALVLATALVLRTQWEVPFEGELMPWRGDGRASGGRTAVGNGRVGDGRTGAGAGRVGEGSATAGYDCVGLTRTAPDPDGVAVVRVAGGAVTEARVRGTNGVDVHLLLGDEELGPGEVLGAGTEILAGRLAAVPGSRLPYGEAGPGLRVQRIRTHSPEPPSLTLDTVEFTVAADHDLLAEPKLFGLATAADGSLGHFPGISAAPLRLASARQSATATFSAEGFRAAAVTLTGMDWLGWDPEPEYETDRLYATFDRPFGFLAVHRASRLVLAAGWVTDPTPFREDDYR